MKNEHIQVKYSYAESELTLSKQVGYYTEGKFRSLQNLPISNNFLSLRYAGEEWCEPNYFFDIPREEYHLHIILEGKGSFKIGEHLYHLKGGDLFLVPPGQYSIYTSDKVDPWHYIWISLSGTEAWHYFQEMGFSTNCYAFKSFMNVEYYQTKVYDILNYTQLSYAHTLRRMSILYELLSLLVQNYSLQKENASSHQKYVEYSLFYIHQNYATCTIEEISKQLKITRNYFFTIFKKEVGVSPKEYLIMYRMEKSLQLLINTKNPISEIARIVGYEDSPSFSKAFKKIYKISPKLYRNQHSIL